MLDECYCCSANMLLSLCSLSTLCWEYVVNAKALNWNYGSTKMHVNQKSQQPEHQAGIADWIIQFMSGGAFETEKNQHL